MAIVPSAATNYSEICEMLRSPKPLAYEEVIGMKEAVQDGDYPFDKHYKLKDIVDRLHRAVFSSDYVPGGEYFGSNGAYKVTERVSEEILFVAKDGGLLESQEYGVPANESVCREHLYYLLDRENFAAVPPVFRVKLRSLTYSWSLYVRTESRSAGDKPDLSLRRCFIHQFRTVNMDASNGNILFSNERHFFPIDGGYSLPVQLKPRINSFGGVDNYAAFRENSVYEQRFSVEEAEYIERIDIEKDSKLISEHLPSFSRELSSDVIKIFRVANVILKLAVEFGKGRSSEENTITLHDLSSICEECGRDRRELLYYILSGDADVDVRVRGVFKDVIRIKDYIRENKGKGAEALTKELFAMFPEKTDYASALRKYSVIYVFGKRVYNCAMGYVSEHIHLTHLFNQI